MEILEGGVRESVRDKNCSQDPEGGKPFQAECPQVAKLQLTATIHWAGVVLPGEMSPGGHEAKGLPSACSLPLSPTWQTPTQGSRCWGPSDVHLRETAQSPASHRSGASLGNVKEEK